MSKKSLAILLLLPFIISILFFVTSSFLFTTISGDITNIVWEYKNQESFSVSTGRVELDATPILANNQEDVDATLVWSVVNANPNEENHAEIQVIDDISYLVFLSEGEVIVSCTNSSGNITKSFRAKLFSGSIVTINTLRSRSYQSIEKKDYYGMYDFINDKEVKASFYLDVEAKSDAGESESLSNYLVETSDNISYDENQKKVTINGSGKGYVKYYLSFNHDNFDIYEFNIVQDGYNVYSYDDLLKCTNEDEEGKIVCLQTNMESLKNTYKFDEKGQIILENNKPVLQREDTVLFGNYNLKTKKYNFANEVDYFESNYNTEYIDQFNEKQTDESLKISKELIAGVHIKKDFYGNGFTLNAHNLTYPKGERKIDNNVFNFLIKDDLFRGPLPYVLIGNNEAPIVKAYGQDNVGFLVDGDNITLNDVFFKNCDFSNILQNNDYTGTVVEVIGDNVTIKNSYLSSGRTVLRAFSTNNLLVKNSLLEKGREFICKIGSNEYEKIDLNEVMNFTLGGQDYSMTRKEFFNSSNEISMSSLSGQLLMNGVLGDKVLTKDEIIEVANIVQEGLNPRSVIEDENHELIYKGDVTFEDTYFYQSGIFSIGIDSQFNGPFLYDGSPVVSYLSKLMPDLIYPDNIGGVSYPTKTTLKGDTRFYDYKTIEETDANCLVFQDAGSLLEDKKPIDLDQFFPIKKLFLEKATEKGYVHYADDKSYLSAAIAKYGGGNNYSSVITDELDNKNELTSDLTLDTFVESMNSMPSSTEMYDLFVFAIGRCVPMAMGFAPFEVMMYNGHQSENAYLFGEKISLDNLRART